MLIAVFLSLPGPLFIFSSPLVLESCPSWERGSTVAEGRFRSGQCEDTPSTSKSVSEDGLSTARDDLESLASIQAMSVMEDLPRQEEVFATVEHRLCRAEK